MSNDRLTTNGERLITSHGFVYHQPKLPQPSILPTPPSSETKKTNNLTVAAATGAFSIEHQPSPLFCMPDATIAPQEKETHLAIR